MSPTLRRNLIDAALVLAVFGVGIYLTTFVITRLRVTEGLDFVSRHLANTSIQAFFLIVIPYGVSWAFWKRSPAELGITLRKLGPSLAWSCGLYAIALAAFFYCSDGPLIANHPIRVPRDPVVIGKLGLSMCLLAATTDIATRGFILLSLARCTPLWFAILMQNAFWIYGHVYEIRALSTCMGTAAGYALFLVLGLLGDSIALRTRNVVGLALGHVLLNVVMIIYIRTL
ncbi:MAG: hypothetical protein HKN12_01835 [Gemmatimonadetes bacterium]|nr:hypothetical protein [Gemmatimonadota bacterium]